MRRLAIAIRSWQDCLRGESGDSAMDTMDTTTPTSQLPHKLGGTPALQARAVTHLISFTRSSKKLSFEN